jgi:hypothetical protein
LALLGYALIKTQIAGCKQLFLCTHCFELFSLIGIDLKAIEERKERSLRSYPLRKRPMHSIASG